MTQEKINRLEQIKNGETPNGYKFTDVGILPNDWNYARLSDISEQITQTAGTEKYETVSISAGIGFVNQAKKFGKELSGKQYAKYTVLHKGDFSYNKGNSKKYPQGCVYRLKDRETAAVPNVFESFRITTGCAEYYDQLFVSGYLNHQLYRLINHGVRDDGLLNLTHKDFYSCLLPVPPLSEQEKIAKILSAQDKVIECYEKKIEQLKRMKKYYLQNMFPKRGEIVPRKRFKGFTDVWEKRKFDDDNDLLSGYPFESEKYSREGIKLVRGMNVKRGYLDLSDEICMRWTSSEGLENYLLEDGDILIQMDGALIGKSYGKIIADQLPALLVQRVTRARAKREKSNSDFMYQIIQRDFLQYIKMNKTETAVPHLSLNDIRNFTIMAPSGEEQTKIGKYFTNLDNLITLHQRKLEEEKKKKKALQQLLLTGIVRTN